MDMNRIQQLLKKLQELAENNRPKHSIDIDLMLDYTRVIYADLLSIKDANITNYAQNSSSNQTVEKENVTADSKSNAIVLEMPSIVSGVGNNVEVNDELNESHADIEEEHPAPTVDAIPHMPLPTIIQKDIRKYIGINDKYIYMNELFHNDKFDYETVLDFINDSKDVSTAIHWIETQYLSDGKWKKEDGTVQDFLQLVKRFFNN